jgi:hypothetical protein
MEYLEKNEKEIVYLVGMHLDLCMADKKHGFVNLKKYGFTPRIVADYVISLIDDKDVVLRRIKDSGYEVVYEELSS